jgi:hypothetical protein
VSKIYKKYIKNKTQEKVETSKYAANESDSNIIKRLFDVSDFKPNNNDDTEHYYITEVTKIAECEVMMVAKTCFVCLDAGVVCMDINAQFMNMRAPNIEIQIKRQQDKKNDIFIRHGDIYYKQLKDGEYCISNSTTNIRKNCYINICGQCVYFDTYIEHKHYNDFDGRVIFGVNKKQHYVRYDKWSKFCAENKEQHKEIYFLFDNVTNPNITKIDMNNLHIEHIGDDNYVCGEIFDFET